MSGNTTHDAGIAFGSVSITSGVITWMDVHANALGAIIAAVSALAYIVFMTLNYVTVRSQVKSKENIKRDVINELIDKADDDERHVIKRVAGK